LEGWTEINQEYFGSMRISKLELKNYRGFADLRVDFPEQGSAVFIGWNGAGKSSVLEGIKVMLFWLSERVVSEAKAPTDEFSDFDVKNGESACVLLAGIKPSGSKAIELKISYNLSEEKTNYQADSKSSSWLVKEDDQAQMISNRSLPVFAYYAVDRRVGKFSLEEAELKRYTIPQQKAYEGAWGGKLQFDHFIRWFVEEENKENREKIRLKDFEYKNPALNTIRGAWQSFFATIGESQYENLRVEEREFNQFTSAPSSLVVTKDGQDLNLQQLSDGERLSLSMVADIAHRLILANPALANPLQGNGIVLIDEIELHLHPAWQRRIVPALEQTFPNIQFIMTTHSPQVLSRVPREHVFILEQFKLIDQKPHTEGRDSNTLLEDVFNVSERPESDQSAFRQLYLVMDDPERQEEAKALLQEMMEKYGEDDPEIQRASMHFEFMNGE
jgi:predicted ATP-binding protein involved in virulence